MFHRSTAIKVDSFVAGGTPLDKEQMERTQRVQIGDAPGQHLYVYTPEDILLQAVTQAGVVLGRSPHTSRHVSQRVSPCGADYTEARATAN